MDWTQIIEVIGGTAVVVAAIAWVAQSTISHFFSRELEKFKIDTKAEHDQLLETLKHQQVTELEALRARQQEALADMRAQAEERLTYLKAALSRVERLEADLIQSRGKGYGEIWKLTLLRVGPFQQQVGESGPQVVDVHVRLLALPIA